MILTPFHGPPAEPPSVPGLLARTLLGFGTHGEVWLADDLTTGAAVAVKLGNRAAEPKRAVPVGVPPPAGIEEETALLCRIDHPHLVRLQRVVPHGESGLALVLDLAAGGSLASLLAVRGQLDPGEVSTLLIPLTSALDQVHRRGLVHGEIAPGNVLFAADGRPQLGDLGVARLLAPRSPDSWAAPGFTDPALTFGADQAGRRAADQWSLAAVAWFALTGGPPLPDSIPADPAIAAAHDRAPALTELLLHCLSADPAARPELDELADRAWQAARPVPVRLLNQRLSIAAEVGLPPLSNKTTHPVQNGTARDDTTRDDTTRDDTVRDDARDDGETAERAGSLFARPSPTTTPARLPRPGEATRSALDYAVPTPRRPVPGFRGTGHRPRVLIALAAIAVGTGCAVTLVLRPAHGGSTTAQSSTTSATAVSKPTPLDAELGLALGQIGRSRAAAFASVSTSGLTRADQKGSPAYRADAALVERLRTRGDRLQGVSYDLRGVHVLRRLGDAVDVAAVVTTSRHQQVGSPPQGSVPVSADGPRSVVFTVIPLGPSATGPARWRVYSVRAGS